MAPALGLPFAGGGETGDRVRRDGVVRPREGAAELRTPPRKRKPSSADSVGVMAGASARSAGAPPSSGANWVSEA
ncbi:hypothetical protein GCM10018771_25460 [Streptomyces cellulosae]|nr:hypothetical protein GCM10018771_25460 [Streptomyces cellulosae]